MDEDVLKLMTEYGLLDLPFPPATDRIEAPTLPTMVELEVSNIHDIMHPPQPHSNEKVVNPEMTQITNDNDNCIQAQGGTMEQGDSTQHLEVKFQDDFCFFTSTWYHVDEKGTLTLILDHYDNNLKLNGTVLDGGKRMGNDTRGNKE